MAKSARLLDAEKRLRDYQRLRNSPRCGLPPDIFYATRTAPERARIDAYRAAYCASLDAQILAVIEELASYSLESQSISEEYEQKAIEARAERDIRQTEITGSTKFQAGANVLSDIVATAGQLGAIAINPLTGIPTYPTPEVGYGAPVPAVPSATPAPSILGTIRANPVPSAIAAAALIGGIYYATR